MADLEARLINGQYALAPNPKRGGMADVFQASDLLQGARKVALKLFKREYTHSQLLAEAFRRESEALQQLRHPAIVELYESGLDKETDRHFLVLEWFDTDLSEWIKQHSFPGWDDFYHDFGRPLLQALAFAHKNQVIHRDVKPSNILVDPRGQPRLADFGIAKIKTWIKPGHTLQDWVSRPFSPPEWDDGSFTYTRDVYGFATIVLYCLTDVELKSYEDVRCGLEELDVVDEIATIIRRCLSEEPRERPSNAIVLLEEIDRLQDKRTEAWAEIPTYYLQLTKKALASLRLAFPGEPDANLQQFVLDDLADVVGLALHHATDHVPSQQPGEGAVHFYAYGANIGYHFAVDQWSRAHLAIVNAWKSSSSALENNRWRAFEPKCRFRFGTPLDPAQSARDLISLTRAVEEHEADIMLQDAERREQERFQVWDRILRAKADFERAKETPLTYRAWKQGGTRLQFWINQPLSEDLLGQPRRVVIDNRTSVIGEVDKVEADRLTLYVKEQYDTDLPNTGKLVFDVAAAQTALQRQSDALDLVRFDRAVRPEIRRLLARPDTARRSCSFFVGIREPGFSSHRKPT